MNTSTNTSTNTSMNTSTNTISPLNEKTNEILDRIEKCRSKNKNKFLLNLWKNYILNKRLSYLQTLEDCESFLNKTENAMYVNEIPQETVLLLYSLFTGMNG